MAKTTAVPHLTSNSTHQYWTFLTFYTRTSGKPLNLGPVSSYYEITQEFPWLPVTKVSFKFCLCYTVQLLCEPRKLYIKKKKTT